MAISVFEDLPADPDLAFLQLEEFFHQEVIESERVWANDDPPDAVYVEYMSKTLSARKELGVVALEGWTRPSLSDFQHGTYLDFRHDVVDYQTAIQIRLGKRATSFSVRLDAKAKKTIHHYTAQIRQLLSSVALDDGKRERLFNKLSAFENEVDRDRTRYDAFADAFVEFAGVLGEAAQAAEPARKWLDSIAKLIWGAKEEEAKQLPPPIERKKIEPPRKRVAVRKDFGALAEELEDEIPF